MCNKNLCVLHIKNVTVSIIISSLLVVWVKPKTASNWVWNLTRWTPLSLDPTRLKNENKYKVTLPSNGFYVLLPLSEVAFTLRSNSNESLIYSTTLFCVFNSPFFSLYFFPIICWIGFLNSFFCHFRIYCYYCFLLYFISYYFYY